MMENEATETEAVETEAVETKVAEEAQAQESESPTDEQAETAQPPAKPVDKDDDHVRKRIDKIVWQREEARREAEFWKRKVEEGPKSAQEKVEDPSKPRIDQFETFEQYTEALAEWKVESRLKKAQEDFETRTKEQRLKESLDAFNERARKVREKFPDYDELFESAAISQAMAEPILESEAGPEIIVYLAKNPDLARKIYSMSPIKAAGEIGKIEAKLDDLLQVKTVTDAKAPLQPVRPSGGTSDGLSDDVDIKTWVKRRNKQLGR